MDPSEAIRGSSISGLSCGYKMIMEPSRRSLGGIAIIGCRMCRLRDVSQLSGLSP